MRKPRDFDSELKALQDKAGQLQKRKLTQLGELIIACHADVLPVEELAGALLAAADAKDAAIKRGWRERGEAFFRKSPRAADDASGRGANDQKNVGGDPSA
jgi:hypothetical protein